MKTLANSRLSLGIISNSHDPLNFTLTFLNCLLHLLILLLHLSDQILIVVLLLNNSRIATLLDTILNLDAILLINLFKVESKSTLLLIEQLLQLLEIGACLNLLKHTILNELDLMIDTLEEPIHSSLQSLRDNFGSDLVHLLQRTLVGSKFLIKDLLQLLGDMRCECEVLHGSLHIILRVDSGVGNQLICLLIKSHEQIVSLRAIFFHFRTLREWDLLMSLCTFILYHLNDLLITRLLSGLSGCLLLGLLMEHSSWLCLHLHVNPRTLR